MVPFEHITHRVARKVAGTFWTLGAVLALGSLAHAETIEFRHEGSAGHSHLPGPHAITRILKEGVVSSSLSYDRNGLLTDVTGDMPLCHEFNVLGKLKRASSEARKSDGCSGATSISYLYTATGEKLAVIEPNKTNVFMGEVRFTNNVPRLSYGGDVETSEDGSSLNYYVRDHLGSVVATASPTQILEKRDHLPYGETWYHTQPGNEHSDQDFNGHYKQGSLLDYNARHYHPTLGKFIQPDSIVPKTDTVGFNRYAYVSNNPVNRIDPSGHNDSYYNKILAAEAAGCVPSCHLDNPYQNMAVGEFDQSLAGSVNSYLAGEASLGGYDLYMAATGNDPIAGDIGMPVWARGLSLAGALPVVPNLTRIFRGVGELRSRTANITVRGEFGLRAKRSIDLTYTTETSSRVMGADEMELLVSGRHRPRGRMATDADGIGQQIDAHLNWPSVDSPFYSASIGHAKDMDVGFERYLIQMLETDPSRPTQDYFRVHLRSGLPGYFVEGEHLIVGGIRRSDVLEFEKWTGNGWEPWVP